MKLPLKWEFPGGKLEHGEDEISCVVREIKEELDINIEVSEKLVPIRYDYSDFKIYLIPFLCNRYTGTIRLKEHRQYAWINLEELDSYDWAEADVPIVQQVKERLA